jgi:type I restriction enzyme S subunit
MNAERLLQHFDRISEAPDAIPCLRRFILDLAVRGKLVPQDPNDEPASELLKRIRTEQPLFTREERLRGNTTVPPFKANGDAFIIPSSWAWVPFGEIMISRDGERVPVSKEERSARPKIYDYYGASGVIDKIDNYLFDKPLLLIGEDGANLINRSTPIAFIARGKYWVNNHAHVLDGISEGFLRYIELHINAIDLKPYVTGTAQPKMNQAKMNSIPIALPPEAEQHRIVAKVDELMALCDQLQAAKTERERSRDRLVAASLHHLNPPADAEEANPPEALRAHARFTLQYLTRLTTRPAHIKQLRQTILNLAVRGKLIPQDPTNEQASEVLGFALAGRIEGKMPFLIPKSWAWMSVGEIAQTRLGKMLDKAKNKGTPRRYLRNVNVRWFDFDLSDILEMRFEDSELEEFALRLGDVLICEGGEPGRAAVWDERESSIYFQKAIHRVRFPRGVNPHYFASVLREASNSRRLDDYFTGVGIKHFTGKGLSSFLVPLPPLAEQHRIVAKVDELMALCDQLEAQLTTTEADSRRLLEAVLHEALNPPLEATEQ